MSLDIGTAPFSRQRGTAHSELGKGLAKPST